MQHAAWHAWLWRGAPSSILSNTCDPWPINTGEDLNVGAKWDVIYEVAKVAKDEKDFLMLLRSSGLSNEM
jgi:hypothetical protein